MNGILFSDFADKVEKRINSGLPGEKVQCLMAPAERLSTEQYLASNPHPRISCVMVLLYPKDQFIKTILTLRPDYRGFHSGQISFPGGKHERSDLTLIDTALREAKEEIGVDPHTVKCVGRLSSLYIPVSNFLVHPFVGILPGAPSLSANAKEVEKIIEVNTDTLKDPSFRGKKLIKYSNGVELMTPYYAIDGHMVWGATAMILSELMEILREV